ncbi:tRNA (cytidine(34)-2'-O)-methyltransferase [Sphingomonas antarctica]|uniref:tRNA (cytidine(34)-2'-O)-methyltransferase n=1 Tax=Sphingomonas antarctica TaxID=2040274 RepID=UPI0039E91360
MRIALYQPEIAGNVGAVLRIAACFGVPVDVIEPTGFVFSDAKLKRAGMDYIERVDLTRHISWDAFVRTNPRLVLLTTHGDETLYGHSFEESDTLLFGQESAGVPAAIAAQCAGRVRIPIAESARSLNLSVACGIAVAEALRQTGGLPC